MSPYPIAVIVGSLRKESFNRRFADALALLAPSDFLFKQVHIADLPLYNQDDDANQAESVKRLKGRDRRRAGASLRDARIQPLDPRRAQERDRPWLAALWPERLGGKPAGLTGVSVGAARYGVGAAAFAQCLVADLCADTRPAGGIRPRKGRLVRLGRSYRRRQPEVSARLDGSLCGVGEAACGADPVAMLGAAATPLLARATLAFALCIPLGAWCQVSVGIEIAPPALPVYAQPPVPGEGYIWTPGYWVWEAASGDYYWVPGTWVPAPNEGDLWTPGYWAFEGSGYFWHAGYWGMRVGYYGGLNYGYGYFGTGYQGGRGDHGAFRYNRAVSNVNSNVIRNIYSAPVAQHGNPGRASFNGGVSGARGHATPGQARVSPGQGAGPTPEQQRHEQAALAAPLQRASTSHGMPRWPRHPGHRPSPSPGSSGPARLHRCVPPPCRGSASRPPPDRSRGAQKRLAHRPRVRRRCRCSRSRSSSRGGQGVQGPKRAVRGAARKSRVGRRLRPTCQGGVGFGPEGAGPGWLALRWAPDADVQ